MNGGASQTWRHRLSSLVFSSEHPTLITAPPGFGVSDIAAYLASDEHESPASVLDVRSVDAERLAIRALKQKHIVFVGSGFPNLNQLHGAQLIDHVVLRLTEVEAIELAEHFGVQPELAQAIRIFTAGWPAYFTSCLDAARQAEQPIVPDDAYDRLHKGPHLQSLIAACTNTLEPSDLSPIFQLTHFTNVSAGLINALLGHDGLQRIQRAGLPIVETRPGWYEILEPVRSTLRSTATLNERTARQSTPELVAEQLRPDLQVQAKAELLLDINEVDPGGIQQRVSVITENVSYMSRSEPRIRLKLLGDFRVFDRDNVMRIPGGKASELIKLLGVRLRPVPTNLVIEHLWGGVSTDVGLRRLKNVVSRTRTALGQHSIARRGRTIELGPSVTSDLAEIRNLLRQLESAPSDIGAAIEAVDLYFGPLLELDVHHDWVTPDRRSIDAAVLFALEVAIDAEGAPAAWALDALARLDPNDDRPYMAVANLASRQGDVVSMQLALSNVQRICADLNATLPIGFDRIAGNLPVLVEPTLFDAART